MFCKKNVLKHFAKFTGKRLSRSLTQRNGMGLFKMIGITGFLFTVFFIVSFLLSSFFILMFKISLYFALFRTNGKNYKFLLFLRILELRDFRTFDPRQILHSRQISDPRQTTPSFRLAPKIYWATPKFYKTYTTHTTRTIFWPLPTTYHALTPTT